MEILKRKNLVTENNENLLKENLNKSQINEKSKLGYKLSIKKLSCFFYKKKAKQKKMILIF